MGGRQKYLLYDNLSFYNPIFSQYAEGKQKVGGVKPYQIESLASADLNRFNVDLVKEIGNIDQENKANNFQVGVSASGGQQPAPLLGATLRSLDQAEKAVGSAGGFGGGLFGAGET